MADNNKKDEEALNTKAGQESQVEQADIKPAKDADTKENQKETKEQGKEKQSADSKKEKNNTKSTSSTKTSGGKGKTSKNSSKKTKSVKSLETELKAQSEILDDVSAKLKKAEEEKNQIVDKYQRLMAEFENMRKRTEKESKRMYDIGAKEVLEKLLPIIDNFERAQMSLTEEQKEDPFVQGVDKIYRQLMDYLANVKVAPMDAEGKEFNPDFHNAVMHVEDDTYGENVVVEELQKGYMYKEEVLRHSMVKVAN